MSTDNQNNTPPTPQDPSNNQPHPNPAAFIADLLEDKFDGPEVEVVAKALRYLGVAPPEHQDDSIVIDFEPPVAWSRDNFQVDGWRVGELDGPTPAWAQGGGPTLIHALAAAWDDYQSKREGMEERQ